MASDGASMRFGAVLIIVAVAAVAVPNGVARTAAQEAAHPGRELPTGAVFLEPTDVPPTLVALWDCPAMDDEFEQRRCEATLHEDRDHARRTVFVALSGASLGRYDFDHHRFPIDVMGLVANQADPAWLARRRGRGRERWAVLSGDRAMMLVGPSVIRAHSVRDGELRDWMHAARGYIEFESDDAAERWRGGLRTDRDGASTLPTILVFRVVRTWTVREPPSAMARLIHESFRTSLGRVADRLPPLRGETYDGVQIRMLGWMTVGPSRDGSGRYDVLASAVVARGRADRRIAEATLDHLRSRYAPTVEAAATTRLPGHHDGADPGRASSDAEDPTHRGLRGDHIAAVVERERPGLVRCWQDATEGTSAIPRVRLELDLAIASSGAVTSVVVSGEGVGTLGPCVERAVRAWTFPAAGADTRARIPIAFGDLPDAGARP